MAGNVMASGLPGWRERLLAAWRLVLFVLVYLFFSFVWTVAASLLVPHASSSPGLEFAALSATVGFLAASMATALLVGAVERRPPSFVGLGLQPGWFPQLGAGFLLGLAMMVAIVLLEWATGHLKISLNDTAAGAVAVRLALFFVVFFAGAAHEEMVSRGYPFQRLMEVLGTPLAVVSQAAIFAGLHYWNPHSNLMGTINTMLVGILFALAYLQTRRLWLPIGLHWSWNFFEAAFGLPVSGITIGQMPLSAEVRGAELVHGGGYGPEAGLAASVVIGAVTVALILRGRRPSAPALPGGVA